MRLRILGRQHLILAILTLFLLALGVMGLLRPVFFGSWLQTTSPGINSSQVAAFQALEQLWEQGDFQRRWQQGEFHCPFFPPHHDSIGENFTKCNPLFFQCVLATGGYPEVQGLGLRRQNGQQYFSLWSAFSPAMQLGFSGPLIAALAEKGISFGYYFEVYPLSRPQEVTAILLADTCSDSYLPEGTYYHGPFYPKVLAKNKRPPSATPAERWDNHGQKIFVDKYLASNQDLWLWHIATGQTPRLDLPAQLDQLYRPALGYSPSEMREYCYFRGKTLLQSHILDAASFYRLPPAPGSAGSDQRGPYPWTSKRKDSFLFFARKQKDYPHSPHFCEKVFTQECLQRKFNIPEFYATDRASWMGIFDVLGGPPEFVDNRFDPAANVRASSYFFPIQSQWHQIGKRARWNLMDFSLNSFQWTNFDEETKQPFWDEPIGATEISLGFRCMAVR